MSVEELKELSNKTFPYLFPLVVNKKDKITDFKNDELFPHSNFINVFRYCEKYPQYDKHVFLVYKYSPKPLFETFINKLKNNSNFVLDDDLDKYTVMLIYKIPKEFEHTLKMFDLGKYSQFSNEAKSRILSFFSAKEEDIFNPVGVLYKKLWRKEDIERSIGMKLPDNAELSSIPNIDKETYFNKYIIQNEQEISVDE
jgi:hypothetical protein